jgi:protease IV
MNPNFPSQPSDQPMPRPSEQPLIAQIVPYQPPRRRWWRVILGFLGFLVILGLGLSMLVNVVLMAHGYGEGTRVQEKFFSGDKNAHDKVVIIAIEGLITDGRGSFIKREVDEAAKDEDVKAVVLRINSPGGTVSGSDAILHYLREMPTKRREMAEKKPGSPENKETNIPIVVSMGGIAASGGYYVAMAVGDKPDTIYAEPATWTGSIGVIIPHYNAKELLEKVGVQSDSVVSNPLKEIGTITRPMKTEERAIFQQLVNESFDGFKKVIQGGRPKFRKDPAALDKLATGVVFTASQAKADGLVDKIGYLEDAVQRATELAGLDKDKVRVVEYKPEFSFWESLMGGEARAAGCNPLAILETAAKSSPQAYYLFTSLPPLTAAKD